MGGAPCWGRAGKAAGTVHWAYEDRQLLWAQGPRGSVWKSNCRAEECVRDEQGGLTNGLGGIRRQISYLRSLPEEQRKSRLFH